MSEDKTIIRVCKSKDNPYVMINKALLQSPDLSAKEKGILAYLLSLPDDWIVHVGELVKHFTDGRDSIYSGIASLIRKGFIKRSIVRQETGQVARYEYLVFESPEALESTAYGKPGNGIPVTTNTDLTKQPSPMKDNRTRYDKDPLYRLDMDDLEQCNQHPL